MFEVRTDPKKNRLYLKLEGLFGAEEIKKAGEQVLRGARSLRPGFDVINDISGFKPAKPDIAAHIVHVQEEMKKLPMGRIVRVMGNNALGKMQFSRTSREAGYDAQTVATLEEAEQLLDAEKKQ